MAFQDLDDGADAASVRDSQASEALSEAHASSNDYASRPLWLGGPDAGPICITGALGRALIGAYERAHGHACADELARADGFPCPERRAHGRP